MLASRARASANISFSENHREGGEEREGKGREGSETEGVHILEHICRNHKYMYTVHCTWVAQLVERSV